MNKFPKNFVWGAASSAYQIEGDPLADGGGKSVWDTFSHTPGKTFEGNTGDTACRSYAHPEWDIENLKHMGLSAYRFSTSWARIDRKGRKLERKGPCPTMTAWSISAWRRALRPI